MQTSKFSTSLAIIVLMIFSLSAYGQTGDINDMSSSSPLWPVAGMIVVGLGFIILFQYKHRNNMK